MKPQGAMEDINSNMNASAKVQKLQELVKKLEKQNKQLRIHSTAGALGGSSKWLLGSNHSGGGSGACTPPPLPATPPLATAASAPLSPLPPSPTTSFKAGPRRNPPSNNSTGGSSSEVSAAGGARENASLLDEMEPLKPDELELLAGCAEDQTDL